MWLSLSRIVPLSRLLAAHARARSNNGTHAHTQRQPSVRALLANATIYVHNVRYMLRVCLHTICARFPMRLCVCYIYIVYIYALGVGGEMGGHIIYTQNAAAGQRTPLVLMWSAHACRCCVLAAARRHSTQHSTLLTAPHRFRHRQSVSVYRGAHDEVHDVDVLPSLCVVKRLHGLRLAWRTDWWVYKMYEAYLSFCLLKTIKYN